MQVRGESGERELCPTHPATNTPNPVIDRVRTAYTPLIILSCPNSPK